MDAPYIEFKGNEGAGQSFLGELLDKTWDGIYFVDEERRITYWNRGAEAISGFSREEVIGRHCFDDILRHVDASGKLLCQEGCPLAATIEDGKERDLEAFLHHKEGHRVPITVRATPIRDPGGKIVGAVETFRDDTARAEALERAAGLQEMAFIDQLTRVGNRRFAELVLAERLDEMQRYGWSFALLFIDVDHFKKVNDEYGHAVGDRVLQMVARTLEGLARSHDFVGRWGGEEFVMLLVNVDFDALRSVAERVRSLVERSGLPTEQGTVEVTVSIGAAAVRPEDSVEDLIKRADERMYESKRAGRNRVTP
jgi:diguanylate cyclase (GGDEF)-like protein/PAS domain S-box-containing protein